MRFWRKRHTEYAVDLLRRYFRPLPLDQIVITERAFPYRVRADLQRAVEEVFGDMSVDRFCGVQQEYAMGGVNMAGCLIDQRHVPVVVAAPQYEEVDVGEEQPVRCLKYGLWLLKHGNERVAALLGPAVRHCDITGIRIEMGAGNSAGGEQLVQRIMKRLEASIERARCYRGKILSLEESEHEYSGRSVGIRVHRLHAVERDQVILPQSTLDLLERNVIDFVRRRPVLAERHLATKKGLLFYGPPGTGKTHTIHFLARALRGHTTLIITAEQVGLLDEYMTLARLLQPSVVVIEDVDLIGRERSQMESAGQEALLNKLLNQMDGLKEDADILFILTTNRPEMLEPALAARPGRVDQAIEFPLPDEIGRAKLVRLYATGLDVPDDLVVMIVKKTDGVSAAFIKELMRRACQFQLERDGDGAVTPNDVEAALDEMLFRGGALNRVLLGATSHPAHAG